VDRGPFDDGGHARLARRPRPRGVEHRLQGVPHQADADRRAQEAHDELRQVVHRRGDPRVGEDLADDHDGDDPHHDPRQQFTEHRLDRSGRVRGKPATPTQGRRRRSRCLLHVDA